MIDAMTGIKRLWNTISEGAKNATMTTTAMNSGSFDARTPEKSSPPAVAPPTRTCRVVPTSAAGITSFRKAWRRVEVCAACGAVARVDERDRCSASRAHSGRGHHDDVGHCSKSPSMTLLEGREACRSESIVADELRKIISPPRTPSRAGRMRSGSSSPTGRFRRRRARAGARTPGAVTTTTTCGRSAWTARDRRLSFDTLRDQRNQCALFDMF